MLLFRKFEHFWLLSAITHLLILRVTCPPDKSAGLPCGTPEYRSLYESFPGLLNRLAAQHDLCAQTSRHAH